ncbi:MAG: serine/threonine protein kinase, partial [Clostridium sp.]|nr:serine/threonine protein kinase [Clostridium sp.]
MLQSEDDKFLHSQQPLLEKWFLEEVIGEGSSGTVYRITDNMGSHFALKVIPITPDDTTGSLSFTDSSPLAEKARLDGITADILSEIKVMQALQNHEGIVACHEYGVLDNADTHTRLIIIRMDLLKPLNRVVRMRETEFTPGEITAMGMDLLTALSECRRHNIIHRDIKPSNIFVTGDNRYLLGDFGSARLLEKTMLASHKGTLAYMAPEIAAGLSFNSTVDIYSLGIVLYQLLNNRRLPFLDASFKFADMEAAIEKRLSGALLPCPENADRELCAIIGKMCAYSPKDRYHSPEECI